MTIEKINDKLKKIDFFKEYNHPEYIPFVGEDYLKYRILHIGESHYIPNYPKWKEGEKDFKGCTIKSNKINLNDFEGWWNGEYNKILRDEKGWFNTKQVVLDYMSGYRDKAHGIFTNTLRSFCQVVTPHESFKSINTENSKKYKYFAFMNFYQQPSIYYGENFSKSMYWAGEYLKWDIEKIEKTWQDVICRSEIIVESVIDVLEPKAVVVTSREVFKCYRDYISMDKKIQSEKCFNNVNVIWLDHPGSPWWYRRKKYAEKSSKELFEDELRRIYS